MRLRAVDTTTDGDKELLREFRCSEDGEPRWAREIETFVQRKAFGWSRSNPSTCRLLLLFEDDIPEEPLVGVGAHERLEHGDIRDTGRFLRFYAVSIERRERGYGVQLFQALLRDASRYAPGGMAAGKVDIDNSLSIKVMERFASGQPTAEHGQLLVYEFDLPKVEGDLPKVEGD
ncbi:MAG: hypothetical protein M9922_14085 [Microthrixaceae bacterium]|nr:hypothetical protein [Microthrixaceae bacterium]